MNETWFNDFKWIHKSDIRFESEPMIMFAPEKVME